MTAQNDERQAWTAHQWAKAIKLEHGKTVESVFSIGKLFLEAKKMLPYGEFSHLFVDLPICRRTAQLYMSIARNAVLANAKWVSQLPSIVGALYELSRVPELLLTAALMEGQIHSGLRREDVRQLFKNHPALPNWSLATAEERLRRAINEEARRASADERVLIPTLLQKLTDEVKEAHDQCRRDDVQAAWVDLEIHDSEPGGYLIFEDERAAGSHPGAPAVISGMRSTHSDWYRDLTTKADGVTPLSRKLIERRLKDLELGCLSTRKTRTTYEAVLMAIRGRARNFSYAKYEGGSIS